MAATTQVDCLILSQQLRLELTVELGETIRDSKEKVKLASPDLKNVENSRIVMWKCKTGTNSPEQRELQYPFHGGEAEELEESQEAASPDFAGRFLVVEVKQPSRELISKPVIVSLNVPLWPTRKCWPFPLLSCP